MKLGTAAYAIYGLLLLRELCNIWHERGHEGLRLEFLNLGAFWWVSKIFEPSVNSIASEFKNRIQWHMCVKLKNAWFNTNCWKISQNIPCTRWGLKQRCVLHHFPSADGGQGWARGSSMNKNGEGGHDMGQGPAAVLYWWQQWGGLGLEVCNSFHPHQSFPEQGLFALPFAPLCFVNEVFWGQNRKSRLQHCSCVDNNQSAFFGSPDKAGAVKNLTDWSEGSRSRWNGLAETTPGKSDLFAWEK